MAVLVPDLLYRDDVFHTGLALEYDERSGRIVRIAHRLELENRPDAIVLRDRALISGFINAHSHAFQRLIRGRTQWRPADSSVADFWTWRQAMYTAALSLSPENVFEVSRWCFIEMLRAGITTVGEFHYLQNAPDGTPYDDRLELAHRVIDAARSAGIRIVLLNTCYARAGINRPIRPEQLRFDTPDLDVFLEQCERLITDTAEDPLVSIGIAPHSVRAVPRDWLPALHNWAAAHDVPFHMHVSEQPAEVEDCVNAYARRPIELLHDDGILDARFTGVHATHITDTEIALLAAAQATVCACPTTERDLGDGYLRSGDLFRAGVPIALGTDSQTMLDMFEEARLVEYIERLRRLERVRLTSGEGRLEVAPVGLRMATTGGARSLRIAAGVLEEGALADFAAIDLEHPTLAGWTADTLGAILVFSAPADVVRDVWVGGRAVVTDGTHVLQQESMTEFNAIARR